MKELVAKITMPDGQEVTVTHRDVRSGSLAHAIRERVQCVIPPAKAKLRLVFIETKK